MQRYFKNNGKSRAAMLIFLVQILFFVLSGTCFAADIVISGNKVIDTPALYKNVVLDMTNGRFTVKLGSTLQIENCTVKVNISSTNPYGVLVENGNLVLKNNIVNVSSNTLVATPNVKATHQLFKVQAGTLNMDGNTFTDDKAYTLAFLETSNITTSGFSISNNKMKNFHGGLYLVGSNNANVFNNTFENVSLSNILVTGSASKFDQNIFLFPGNLVIGDAFDIVNASSLTISNNVIASSAGFGIYIAGGQNIFIENNQISDGSSFAVFIDTPSNFALSKHKYLQSLLMRSKLRSIENSNIVLTYNYMALNRYGILADTADHLIVTNNVFIQRFIDSSVRQRWTNNDILLADVTNLIWEDNLYKEAFTQDVPGDNSNTLQFVPFPKHGGVLLP